MTKDQMFNQEERSLTNAMDAEAERRNADAQRTPGEWIFRKYSPYDYGVYSQDGNGNDIALVREYGSQGAANAAFICKAVNNYDSLLEALERLTFLVDSMIELPEFPLTLGDKAAIETAKEAIKKSEQVEVK